MRRFNVNEVIHIICKATVDVFTTPPGGPTRPDNSKARIASLQTGAGVASFLAGVQAQTLSLSFSDNTTALHIGINALAFAGVLFDVVGAFLALLASTVVQTNSNAIHNFLATTLRYDASELKQVNDFVWISKSNLEWAFWTEVLRLKRENGGEENNDVHLPSGGADEKFQDPWKPAGLRTQLRVACDRIAVFDTVGDAAGTATLLGILCFLASVVCLAVATQPTAVWIPAVIASSCVFIIPLMNGLFAIQEFRCPNIFGL